MLWSIFKDQSITCGLLTFELTMQWPKWRHKHAASVYRDDRLAAAVLAIGVPSRRKFFQRSSFSNRTNCVRINCAGFPFEGTVDNDMPTRGLENLLFRAVVHLKMPEMRIILG